jgi:uncharacterized membrane protein
MTAFQAERRNAAHPLARGQASDGAGGLAMALGLISIGLGLAEAAAPRTVAQFTGVPDDGRNRRVLRAVALREIVTGLGILARPQPAGWIWARVAGDVLDLSLLAAAARQGGANRGRIGVAAAAVAGVTLLDVVCADLLGGHSVELAGLSPIQVKKTVTIGKPAEELYRFWRDVENLPRVMRHLESVRKIDERRSVWKARAPLGIALEWESEITGDEPNRRIAWRSAPESAVANTGSVSFASATGGRGTVVKVELRYRPPGGAAGAAIAKLFGKEPGQQLQEDLRAFKQSMETGEIVRSDASIRFGHPARPPTGAELEATRC